MSERVVRTLDVDGHEVSVVEDMEEEGAVYVIAIDEAVLNPEAPLAEMPTDEQVVTIARRWLTSS